MAIYKKKVNISGSWAKASELKSGMKAKIVSETNPTPSTFLNKDGSAKTQEVCQVKFEGLNDVLNVSLNSATINGLVDAFGEDSSSWMNHILTVETERMRVAGKAVTALFLVPEGYAKEDDVNGYAQIVKKGSKDTQPAPKEEMPVVQVDEEENAKKESDLPF